VAHACNPSYSGGRDQEDHSSKPVQANSLQDPILKNLSHKRAGRVAQGLGPEFKPQYHKKKVYFLLLAHAIIVHGKCFLFLIPFLGSKHSKENLTNRGVHVLI
jgi:hypothetical protein